MPWWKLALWVALVAATLTFLYLVRAILLPFVLAWLVAIVLEPAVRKLRLKGWSKNMSVLFITTIFLIVAGGIIAGISTPVVRQIGQVQEQIQGVSDSLVRAEQNENPFLRWNPAVIVQPPGPLEAVDGIIEGVSPMLERVGLPSSRSAIVSEYVDPQGEQIATAVTGFFNSFVGIISTLISQAFLLLLVPILAVYMLLDMERLRLSVASWIPPQFRDTALDMSSEIGDVFKSYLRGITITILLYAVVSCFLLGVLGTPYFLLLGLLAGAVMIVPFLGQLITNAAIFLVVGFSGVSGNWFIELGSPWAYALFVTAIFLGLSTVFDQFVVPKIVGQAVNLPFLAAMFVAMAGATLFGLIGMVIAYPVAGAIKVSLERLLRITTTPAADTVRLPSVPLRHRHT